MLRLSRARVELIRPGTSQTDQPNDLKANLKLFDWIIWKLEPNFAQNQFLRSVEGAHDWSHVTLGPIGREAAEVTVRIDNTK